MYKWITKFYYVLFLLFAAYKLYVGRDAGSYFMLVIICLYKQGDLLKVVNVF